MEHRQEIAPDGQVFSQQTLRVGAPLAANAHLAGDIYWEFLRRFGRPVLGVTVSPDTGAVRLSLPGLTLLTFHPPVLVPEGLRYPIDRGAAVDPAHTGEGYLQMGVAPDAVSLTVQGYYPNLIRLSTRIYEWTQSALHVRVARGYLPLLAERLRREATPR